MGQLFFAPFDQSQRTAVVFAARVGYLRAGARVVSHEAFKPFTQILAIGRVLSARLSAIPSATAQRQPMDARMADGVLRCEGREIGCREAGEPNAELCIYLVRLHANTTQRRGSLCLDFLERANVRAHANGGSHDSSPFISSVSGRRSLATHLRSIQSLAGCQRARGRLDDGGIVAFMLLRLRTIVL